MKHLVYIFLIPTILISCDDIFPKEEEDSSGDDGDKKEKIYNGVRKNYYKGKLASTVTYKDSLKNGPAINYYPDGKVNMEFMYENNQKHGPFKWYYENGKLYMEGEYYQGEKDGVFKIYRKNGKLKSEMPWHLGNPCVGLVEYFDSGKKKPKPTLKVKHKNTIKLDGEYTIEIGLSEKGKYAKYYEGYLEENQSFPDYFGELKNKNGKAYITYYVQKGDLIMKTITLIAKLKSADDNYHIITREVNIAAENRRSVVY